jgi:hypothetical protein
MNLACGDEVVSTVPRRSERHVRHGGACPGVDRRERRVDQRRIQPRAIRADERHRLGAAGQRIAHRARHSHSQIAAELRAILHAASQPRRDCVDGSRGVTADDHATIRYLPRYVYRMLGKVPVDRRSPLAANCRGKPGFHASWLGRAGEHENRPAR